MFQRYHGLLFTEDLDIGSVLRTGRKRGIDLFCAVVLVFHRQRLLFWILALCFEGGSGRKFEDKKYMRSFLVLIWGYVGKVSKYEDKKKGVSLYVEENCFGGLNRGTGSVIESEKNRVCIFYPSSFWTLFLRRTSNILSRGAMSGSRSEECMTSFCELIWS